MLTSVHTLSARLSAFSSIFFSETAGPIQLKVNFLMVLWVGLQCVIVVFPDHTYLAFSYGDSLRWGKESLFK